VEEPPHVVEAADAKCGGGASDDGLETATVVYKDVVWVRLVLDVQEHADVNVESINNGGAGARWFGAYGVADVPNRRTHGRNGEARVGEWAAWDGEDFVQEKECLHEGVLFDVGGDVADDIAGGRDGQVG